jgi:hypothetical protein
MGTNNNLRENHAILTVIFPRETCRLDDKRGVSLYSRLKYYFSFREHYLFLDSIIVVPVATALLIVMLQSISWARLRILFRPFPLWFRSASKPFPLSEMVIVRFLGKKEADKLICSGSAYLMLLLIASLQIRYKLRFSSFPRL